jgi:Tc toxin complex TcA C-terminal TcB-binding domain/Neuraminidase-like domain
VTDSYRTLGVGSSGGDVRALHARLLDLGADIAYGELVAGFFGGSTRNELIIIQRRLDRAATGVADPETVRALQDADAPRHCYVVGQVLGPSEEPVPDALVQAFDRDIRGSAELGEAATHGEGWYLVRYAPEREGPRERGGGADVYVRVLVGDRVVYDPPMQDTIFNVAPLVSITIRLTVRVAPERSEYETAVATIEPLLGDLGWSDLKEDDEYHDVTFLAGQSGLDQDHVTWAILANRLAPQSSISPYFFYALFAEQTLAAAQRWLSLTPRLHLTISMPAGPLLNDIVLLPQVDIETAVRDATSTFIVPQRLTDELPEILDRLRERQEEAREWASRERQRVLRAQVAHLADADLADQVTAVLDADEFGDLPAIMNKLGALPLVPSGSTDDDVLGALVLAEFAGDDPVLIGRVRERFGITGAGDVHRLAELTAADWATVIDAPAQQQAGAVMEARMARRFPTTAFAARLAGEERPPVAHAATVAGLLAGHPDFDLAHGNVARLLAAHGEPLDGGVAAALRTTQRVFRLAPAFARTKALLGTGITSAAAMMRRGRQRFVREAVGTGAFTADEAMRAFDAAASVHSASLLVAGQLHGAAAATLLPALASGPAKLEPVVKYFPNMKSLFQTIDFTQCDDCQSVHGAAAYLADVLHYLADRLVTDTTQMPPVTSTSALDVLLGRRPDLVVTDLNCENTNTTVPYLDMVCELLEDAVAPDPGIAFTGTVVAGLVSAALLTALQGAGLAFTASALVYGPDVDGAFVVRDTAAVAGISPEGGGWRIRVLRQTFGTSDELAAAPQYVNAAAYQQLAASVWCFTLPFDLAHEETRRYFAQFGIDRADLMRRLQAGGTPSDAACAAEHLGLGDGQRTLTVTPNPAGQPTIWNTPGPPASATLSVVATFVTRAGITYQDLLDLLTQTWVDGGQELFVQHLDSSADLAQKRIVNLDDNALDRIHRFIRARNATAWPSATLDRAIRSPAGGAGTLDDACLIAFTELADAAGALSVTVDAVLDVFETLNVDDPNGTYAAVFLDPVRVGAVDPRFLPTAVHANEAAEQAVPGSGIRLSAALDSLGLALGTNPPDTARLIAAAGANPPLTATTISVAYSLSQIAVDLGLAVSEVADLIAITGSDPRGSAAALIAFAQAGTAMLGAALPIATWRYLLRHEAADLAALDLPTAAITAILAGLHSAYNAALTADSITVPAPGTPTENTALVRPFLAKLPGITATTLAQLQTLLTDTWTDPSLSESQLVDNAFGGYFDTTAIKAALVVRASTPPPKDAAENAVISAVAGAVSGYLYLTDRQAALSTAIATAFAIDENLAGVVLAGALLKEPPSAGQPVLLDVLLDDSTSAATADLQQRALRLLNTIVIAIGKLGLATPTIGWLLSRAVGLGWLELDHLPYDPGQPTVAFTAWQRFQGFLDLLAASPAVANPANASTPFTVSGFFDAVLAPQPVVDLLSYLGTLTGTDPSVLAALDAHLSLSTPDVSAYRDPGTVSGLLGTVVIVRTLGLDVPTAIEVTKPVLGLADAMSMRLALKSRYADAQWLGVLQQIQDPLREMKRDALAAFLLAANADLSSVDDLYDYFLIDSQMAACMSTSRIVQAHATVQLFAMRCLMGLEAASVASVGTDDGWAQWDWVANFRVWEANRKIFLWPENWISPDLRDDKSELFVALENALQQDALTDDAVEQATNGYLEALDDLAHLEVMAAYYDTAAYVEHVFARTRGGSPSVYYYRQFQAERAWTPWQKVPLDITGEQLLAFSRNSRLTLAWPQLTKEPDDSGDPPDIPDPASLTGGQPTHKPNNRWKIQLAVSEFADGRWREKRVSDTALYTSYYDVSNFPTEDQFTLLVWGLGASQAISCFLNGGLTGSFALTGCKGLPEAYQGSGTPGWFYPRFVNTDLDAGRFMEETQYQGGELAIQQMTAQTAQLIFGATPAGLFEVTYPLQMTIIDWLVQLIELWAAQSAKMTRSSFAAERGFTLPTGTLLPYYFGDYSRDYVLVPGFYPRRLEDVTGGQADQEIDALKKTASDVLRLIADIQALISKYLDKHKQDPMIPIAQLIQEALTDPAYLAIVDELQAYRRLRYGVQVRNFYHPLVCLFREQLNGQGIPALMARDTQLTDTGFDFAATYQPTAEVIQPYPREDVDFELAGAYSSYNWELFFHLPFDIAMRLNADQQFDNARDWFHYIFNPVGAGDAPAPQRYWITKPFFQMTAADYLAERVDTIMNAIAADPSGASIGDLAFAVAQWRENPFKPDVVARSRPVAYQMAIVMNYVQNLIDWGDNLFGQFTRESVNQATQLYILADKLLGPKPQIVPPAVPVPAMTYNQLRGEIDLFGNALLDLENLVPDISALPHHGQELPPPPATLTSLYFCIPPNDNLLALWDLVADRLFKIRNCQNIDGIAASLALFAPPIDPGALVRAAAEGLDISAFLAGLSAPTPYYRFTTMAAKATELTQHVASLGTELLAALEKQDGEALARLRESQEIAVLNSVRAMKLSTIEEAKGAVTALQRSRDVVQERIDFYSSQQYMNTWEITAVALNGASLLGEVAVALGYALAGGLKLIPNFMAGGAGFGGSPTVNASTGGESAGGSAETAAAVLGSLTRTSDKAAGMASTQASYQRRNDEWQFQLALAQKDAAQIDQQIANANLHLTTLALDLQTHALQTQNAQAILQFMLTKYTSQELYTWMIGQVSTVYYQAYKIAYDTAKKAERCYGYELASNDTFISFGYWNSQKKGLLAADALVQDIKRMEAAYLDNNAREYELTKHVSLAQIDPGALVQLKATGSVTVQVPEVAFDLDHPNHYLRRIKTVSVSLVCNAGPYTTVGLTLSLVANKYRNSTAAKQGAVTDKDKYAEDTGSDPRFAYNIGSISSIATSSAVSDTGLFELNFHDERYLPFEGAGAISTWQIQLPTAYQQFDYDTISDLILHIRYTAREGGAAFRAMTEKALGAILNETVLVAGRKGLYVAFSLRDSFPSEWWQLSETGSTSITIDQAHLPYLARAHNPALAAMTWAAEVQGAPASYPITIDGTATTLNRDPTMTSLCVGTADAPVLGTPVTISCDASNLQDLTVLISYTVS